MIEKYPIASRQRCDYPKFMEREIWVRRRNRQVVPWQRGKIEIAIRKALLAEKGSEDGAAAVADAVEREIFSRGISPVDIETIQDAVQDALLASGEENIALSYATYRRRRREGREDSESKTSQQTLTFVHHPDGTVRCWTDELWLERIGVAARGLNLPEKSEELIAVLRRGVGDGPTAEELRKMVLSNALRRAKTDPSYGRFAAGLGLQFSYEEVLGYDVQVTNSNAVAMEQKSYFLRYIKDATANALLDHRLENFNVGVLANALDISRDTLLDWSAFDLLSEEFLLRSHGHPMETPQIFWMRVAMGIFIGDAGRGENHVLELYDALSRLEFCPASTTLLYAGTPNQQLLPSYVYVLRDTMEDIMVRGIAENAFASRWGAGLCGSWSHIRGKDSEIGGSRGVSEGIEPFLQLHRHQLAIANQGSHRRRGAGCATLDLWHWDLETFIELRRKMVKFCHGSCEPELRTCLWVPDLFMERLEEKDGYWTLFQPMDVPGLAGLWGVAFEENYLAAEALAVRGKICSRQFPIQELWKKILALAFETGFPTLAFKDTFNRSHYLALKKYIPASSLFGEMAMAANFSETAAGAFGTISLLAHSSPTGTVDREKFRGTIRLAMEALDSILSVSTFPSESIARHCDYYRGLCLGLAGLHDVLRRRGLPFDSPEAEREAETIFGELSDETKKVSESLARQLGPCGADPILRNAYRTVGTANTRTAKLLGVFPGACPAVRNGHSVSMPDGNRVWILDAFLADTLKARNLWRDDLGERLNHMEGDVAAFPELPEDLRAIFATAFDCNPERLLAIAAGIQRQIDQSQALPLRLRMPTLSQLSSLMVLAWKLGIKSIGPTLTAQSLASERAREKFSP
ncbi:MAG: hypothetical protein LBS68_03395 [Puniceicoccales bacterium]|jgi:ribonucleoside-diphosphate reductase alpha chain|nr:hypothetical protein [Puniceicoccales bacterium]